MSVLKIKDQNGNWIQIPTIKGEDGQDYILTENDKQEIAGLVDTPVDDVQINGTSIIENGVANIPVPNASRFGVVKVTGSGSEGIVMNPNYQLRIYPISSADAKAGTAQYRPVTPMRQHESVFYGLAKSAGSDEKNSTLPVGQYTESAQTAIKQMLGVKDDYDSLVVEVSGTDLVITGKPSYRYNCGELYTLSITPPASGTMDIIFTSGTTPTVLTLPETVKMPDWWAGIETNTTYEMCITDGTYCGVMSWAT